MVALLAGGTGGAKLAAGLYDLLGSDLTVIANTGDDVEEYGVHVSPDPDLITYRLAGMLDERGWGIAGDTWGAMDAFAAAGRETWFRLGDRDLALCLVRTELLRAGERLTDAHAAVVEACGVAARVLPASDEPVRTWLYSDGGWIEFQRFMVALGAAPPVERVDFRGAEHASATPEVVAAIEAAETVVIGPSNPVISIGPILAVPGVREALARRSGPSLAMSPLVGGRALKGPTEAFMELAGIPLSAAGIGAVYDDLVDAVVSDEEGSDLTTDTHMPDAGAARRLARETLEFAASL